MSVGQNEKVVEDYNDPVVKIGKDFADLATAKLTTVLQRCHDNRLVLKMKTSWIGTNVVTFFCYEVKPGSWSLSQSRKDAISTMLFPTTQKQMRSFLGAANFLHTHIPNYADRLPCCTNALLLAITGRHLATIRESLLVYH